MLFGGGDSTNLGSLVISVENGKYAGMFRGVAKEAVCE